MRWCGKDMLKSFKSKEFNKSNMNLNKQASIWKRWSSKVHSLKSYVLYVMGTMGGWDYGQV